MKNLHFVSLIFMVITHMNVFSMEENLNETEEVNSVSQYKKRNKKRKVELDYDADELNQEKSESAANEVGWNEMPTEIQMRILFFVINVEHMLDGRTKVWDFFKQFFILKLISKSIGAMAFDKQVFDLKEVAKQTIINSWRELALIPSSIGFRTFCEELLKLGCFDGKNLALISAIFRHDIELIHKLIELKRSQATFPDGTNEIMVAAAVGNVDILKLLLELNETDINARNNYLHTSLMCACLYGSKAAVKLLLDNGANLHDKDQFGETGLMHGVMRGNNGIVQILLDEGANIHEKNNLGCDLMMLAGYNGRVNSARLFLDKGADLDEQNHIQGATALSYAAEYGHKNMIEFLLENKANVNVRTHQNETPLMFASWKGHNEIVSLLLENGADVNAESNKGKTALMIAAECGRTKAVKLLLENGASIDKKNNEGKTALMLAAEKGHTSIVKLLLAAEEDTSITVLDSDEIALALNLAISNGHKDTAELLEQHLSN